MNIGIAYAVGAYLIWGILPAYWKQLHHVPAPLLLSHRILWSFLFLLIVIGLGRKWQAFRAATRDPKALLPYVATATVLGFNWLIYIWAVNNGFIVESSLGYFINPLVSVVMGVLFLRERLRPWQWVPIGLAAVGVLYLTIVYGALPWIALTLALTFAFYGLVKKTASLGSLDSLTLETGFLLLPALAYLVFSETTGQGVFLHGDALTDLLLISTGLMTAIPLLMFSAAARRIPLSHVGMLQYIAPTGQFLIGILVYDEPFSSAQLTGFSIVWVALIIFVLEGFLASREQAALSH